MANKILLIIIYIILTGLFASSLIYLIFIKKDTSSGNPLILEEESDRANYFKNISYNDYPDKAFCQCGDNIFLDFCNEDLLKAGCKNFYESKKIQKFQNNECEFIQNKIMIENAKLIDIFKLETNSINSSISSLFIFNIVIFVLILLAYPLYVIFSCLCFKSNNSCSCFESNRCCCCCICDIVCKLFTSCWGNSIVFCLFFVILILLIIDIVIFSDGCSQYNGDDTSKYLEFLECSNVNKEGFYKFSAIEDLSFHFIILKILQSVFIASIFVSGLYIIIEKIYRFNKEIDIA